MLLLGVLCGLLRIHSHRVPYAPHYIAGLQLTLLLCAAQSYFFIWRLQEGPTGQHFELPVPVGLQERATQPRPRQQQQQGQQPGQQQPAEPQQDRVQETGQQQGLQQQGQQPGQQPGQQQSAQQDRGREPGQQREPQGRGTTTVQALRTCTLLHPQPRFYVYAFNGALLPGKPAQVVISARWQPSSYRRLLGSNFAAELQSGKGQLLQFSWEEALQLQQWTDKEFAEKGGEECYGMLHLPALVQELVAAADRGCNAIVQPPPGAPAAANEGQQQQRQQQREADAPPADHSRQQQQQEGAAVAGHSRQEQQQQQQQQQQEATGSSDQPRQQQHEEAAAAAAAHSRQHQQQEEPAVAPAGQSQQQGQQQQQQQPATTPGEQQQQQQQATPWGSHSIPCDGVQVGTEVDAFFHLYFGVMVLVTMEVERAVGALSTRVYTRHVSQCSFDRATWLLGSNLYAFHQSGPVKRAELLAARHQRWQRLKRERSQLEKLGYRDRAGVLQAMLAALDASTVRQAKKLQRKVHAKQRKLIRSWRKDAKAAALQQQLSMDAEAAGGSSSVPSSIPTSRKDLESALLKLVPISALAIAAGEQKQAKLQQKQDAAATAEPPEPPTARGATRSSSSKAVPAEDDLSDVDSADNGPGSDDERWCTDEEEDAELALAIAAACDAEEEFDRQVGCVVPAVECHPVA